MDSRLLCLSETNFKRQTDKAPCTQPLWQEEEEVSGRLGTHITVPTRQGQVVSVLISCDIFTIISIFDKTSS